MTDTDLEVEGTDSPHEGLLHVLLQLSLAGLLQPDLLLQAGHCHLQVSNDGPSLGPGCLLGCLLLALYYLPPLRQT